jgi:hypothetical protein
MFLFCSFPEKSQSMPAIKKVGRVRAMADRIREELGRTLPQKTVTIKAAGQRISGDDRNIVEFQIRSLSAGYGRCAITESMTLSHASSPNRIPRGATCSRCR